MKIAQIATLTESVPPVWHGGIETIVSLITEELVRRGHEVTLFASADSKTTAKLIPTSKMSFRKAGKSDVLVDMIHASKAFSYASDFDIIHNHTDYFGLGFIPFIETPCITTLHSPFTESEVQTLLLNFPDLAYVALSYAHKRSLPPNINIVKVINNGIDVESFPFSDKKQDYMLFLGRIHPDKGTDIAINVARETGKPLVIAAQIDRYNHRFFNEVIKPQIDNKLIFFEGEVDQDQKRELLKNASCAILPVRWPEPFGLVMAEAMACGTPVVALNRGATEEVVIDGKTGFLAETESGLAYAVENISRIKSEDCREHVEKNFSCKKMVDNYVDLYESIVDKNIIFNLQSSLLTKYMPQKTPAKKNKSINFNTIYDELSLFLKELPEKTINNLENASERLVQEWTNLFIKNSINEYSKGIVEEFYKISKYFIFELCAQSLDEVNKEYMIYIGDKLREYGIKSVLHYGSGIGDLPYYVASDTYKLSLAEIDGLHSKFAKCRHEGEKFNNISYYNIENVKIADLKETFPCVICMDVLEHRFSPYDYFEYILSILEDDGILILDVDFRETINYPLHLENNEQYRYTFKPEEFGLVRLNNRQPAIYRKTKK